MIIRVAEPADRTRVVRTLQRAFVADPVMRWFFPDDDTYEEESAPFYALMFDLRVERHTVWCTDDVAVVACWEPPDDGTVDPEWRDRFWAEGASHLTERTRERMMLMQAAISPHELPQPRWYLALLGTHPDWQRQGLGRAAMAPALETADRDGVMAGLVTETPENVAFYRGVGFEVAAEPRPDGGPQLWILQRAPR